MRLGVRVRPLGKDLPSSAGHQLEPDRGGPSLSALLNTAASSTLFIKVKPRPSTQVLRLQSRRVSDRLYSFTLRSGDDEKGKHGFQHTLEPSPALNLIAVVALLLLSTLLPRSDVLTIVNNYSNK